MDNSEKLEKLIEALLMVSKKPLAVSRIKELLNDLNLEDDAVKNALKNLTEFYKDRGINLAKLATGYCFVTDNQFGEHLNKLWEEKPARYSRAFLEILVIIAYRQPVTRGEIEAIRGVAVSTNILRSLLEREWVKVVGYKEVPGKPAIYATTKEFLDHFGLSSISELPALPEIQDLENKELDSRLRGNDEPKGGNDESTKNSVECTP